MKFCILKGRSQEAVFWAQEALDSEMRSDVLEALLWVWALTVTAANPWWLTTFRETAQKGPATTDEEIQYLVMYLASNTRARDGTATALLGLGLRPDVWSEERVGQPTLPTFDWDLTQRQLTVARALKQGKLAFAWGLLLSEWDQPNRAWNLLKTVAPDANIHLLETACIWLPLDAKRWIWPLRAAAVALAGAASLPPKPTQPFEPSIELVAYRYSWLHSPMRFRRLHSPQPMSLFWLTARGQLATSETTEREIMDGLEDALRSSCPFWYSRAPELVASDDSREEFYSRYFPTDIPDEWTAAERQVSHGRGVISDPATTDWTLKFETTLNMWFGALPCQLWQGLSGSLRAILAATSFDASNRPAELFETVAAAYEKSLHAAHVEPSLKPVRREIVVA